jgi:general stress protein 26
MADTEPVAEQLTSPPDTPLTPWTDVRARLERADDYLLATVRPDGRPHVVPVLAVWIEGALYFNSRPTTRKARNLEREPRCAMSIGDDTFDLTVEGRTAKVRDAGDLARVAASFTAKYPFWRPTLQDGAFYPDGANHAPSDVYELTPTVAFGFGKEHGFSATRWRFRP